MKNILNHLKNIFSHFGVLERVLFIVFLLILIKCFT